MYIFQKKLLQKINELELQISNLRKLEADLKKSETRLKRAESASRSGNWELHLDAGKIIGSAGAMNLYGMSESEMDYNIIKELPLPEYRPILDEALYNLLNYNKPYKVEFRIITYDTREEKDILSIAEFDRENRVLYGSIQDITDRKKAENEILKKNSDLTDLFRISMSLLDTVDRRQVLRRIVDEGSLLMGSDTGALYLINGNEISLEATYPPLPENYKFEFNRAKASDHPHMMMALAKGSEVIIHDTHEASLTPQERLVAESRNLRSVIFIPLFAGKLTIGSLILGTSGQPHHYTENELGSYRTLSNIASIALENSVLFDNLSKAKERAEESDRLKTAFLHNISHEIRTPLNAIIGFSAFLDQHDLDPALRKEYLNIIFQSNGQLLSIIEDIINISQIEAGQVQLRENEMDIISVCKSLFSRYKPEADRKRIDFDIVNESGYEALLVNADEHKLTQALSSLLGNAVKFTDEGFIRFIIRKSPERLIFIIEDSGIGIPAEEQKKIFERFYKIESKKSDFYGGTGLGLAIADSYVSLMGGKISLESEPGKGSRFMFSIPYQKSQNENPGIRTARVQSADKPEKSKTILIAEDEESNYLLIKAMLENHDFKLVHAQNGKIAVDIMGRGDTFDLVLMDLKMPLMDGFEATLEIKKINPLIPIIAQSAYATSADFKRAAECGCASYLTKPFSKSQLLATIEKYITS